MNEPKIIVALDGLNEKEVFSLVNTFHSSECALKVGKELFLRGGPHMVKTLIEKGFKIFLDLKFHDIPNTVARACQAAQGLGVWMLTLHCLGGRKMLEAAVSALDPSLPAPLLMGVTLLTSFGEKDLHEVGISQPLKAEVLQLAQLAKESGLSGVISSPQEVKEIKKAQGPHFLCVTPGIRPAGSALDDQTRIMTPEEALKEGADYLVIGRPITQAKEPQEALKEILHSL